MHPPMPPGPITGPSVWYGRDLATRASEWIHRFSRRASSRRSTLRCAHSRRPAARSRRSRRRASRFRRSELRLRRLLHELLEGRGFFMLRGLPGRALRARGAGDRVHGDRLLPRPVALAEREGPPARPREGPRPGHLGPEGSLLPDQPQARVPHRFVDLVGLLCLQTARAGGESFLVSSTTLYNEILARRPDLVPALFEPFPTDRRGEVPDGMKPWFDMPMYHWHAGRLTLHLRAPVHRVGAAAVPRGDAPHAGAA